MKKLRLTGGEPTVRPGIVDLVGAISATPGIEDVAMTTNGLVWTPWPGRSPAQDCGG